MLGFMSQIEGRNAALQEKVLIKCSTLNMVIGIETEEDISEVLELNKENMQSIIDVVKSACDEGNPLDLILRKMYEHFGMKNSAANHALLSSTIKSYITYLQDRSELECIFCDNVMCWKCV